MSRSRKNRGKGKKMTNYVKGERREAKEFVETLNRKTERRDNKNNVDEKP